MSWGMGLTLVPLINSSKQKIKYRTYHDLNYVDIPDNAVDNHYIAVERVPLAGWLQKADISFINDAPLNVDTYFGVAPQFIDGAKLGYSGVAENNTTVHDMIYNMFDAGNNKVGVNYSNVRPVIKKYMASGNTEVDEGRVQNYNVEYMKWLEAGDKFWHHMAYGADGTLTTGSIEIYIEWTFIIANFNNRKNRKPVDGYSFLCMAGTLNPGTGHTWTPSTGMRLYGIDVHLHSGQKDDELHIGVGSHLVENISADTSNDIHLSPVRDDIIRINNTMYDYSTNVAGTNQVRYFQTKPIFLNKGDPLNFRAYGPLADGAIKFHLTAQVLPNYQETGVFTVDFSNTGSNPNLDEIEIVFPWDVYVTEIETDIIARNDNVSIEHIEIYGIKKGEFFPSSIDGFVGAGNISNHVGYTNMIDRINIGVNADSLGQAVSMAIVNDYYQQDSRIFIDQSTSNFDEIQGTMQIHFKNARKLSTKNVLNFWNNDPSVHQIRGGR